ncbi:Pyrimidine 5'-nucleotidase YjjG [Paraliobacillus sp. PM-2]|uniref:HAD family hydrolase n=1 Tax=Paraliobacillus sp. PM-2 TaxID=1462524 RepID=UPI00061BFBD3|nr:HAD-IA family hydrolase [Paraliobacillus sp. PM-2]CQR46818.1 Pyrimidine 5'-nucleotidase YjjG [Paraliobacillus sp. PM-2]
MKYIWFDLGYTLVYVNRELSYQHKLKQIGVDVSLEELKLAYHYTDKYFMREFPGLLGKNHEAYATSYHKILHDYLNLTNDLNLELLMKPDYVDEPKGRWRAFDDTIPVLRKLKEKGIGVGLISNWNHTARKVLEETGIIGHLDHIIVSSEVDVEKPNERIFNIALEKAGVAANECLYVGDNYYDDVVGSRKVGMDSILINPFDKKGIEEVEDVQVISNIKELLPTIKPVLLSV